MVSQGSRFSKSGGDDRVNKGGLGVHTAAATLSDVENRLFWRNQALCERSPTTLRASLLEL